MSDYISRQEALEAISLMLEEHYPYQMVFRATRILHHIPTADVVDVVRCKDCKHRYIVGNGLTHYWVCNFLDAENKDDGYCSYGERAEQ